MRTLFLTLATAAVLFMSCSSGKRILVFEELPAPLQTLLTQHFPGEDLVYATTEKDNMTRHYDLLLSEGTEIEADSKGQWYEIKCPRGKSVPEGVVPQQIWDYVSAKHPGVSIRTIELKKKGYEIELSNGLEIKFDKNFMVREYDH